MDDKVFALILAVLAIVAIVGMIGAITITGMAAGGIKGKPETLRTCTKLVETPSGNVKEVTIDAFSEQQINGLEEAGFICPTIPRPCWCDTTSRCDYIDLRLSVGDLFPIPCSCDLDCRGVIVEPIDPILPGDLER